MYRIISLLLICVTLSGCATAERTGIAPTRKFEFHRDTFAFANELAWEYQPDPSTGTMTTRKRAPKPEYALHCFVLARSARQFFRLAEFDPTQPKSDERLYQRLVRQIAATNPRDDSPPGFGARSGPHRSPLRTYRGNEIIIVPGHSDFREFSAEHEELLKAELGGAWQSYLQRGNWRMVFPFSRGHQQRTAQKLAAALRNRALPIVHLARFPELTINHALLLFDFAENASGIDFVAYDPNNSDAPVTLTFDRAQRSFLFGANRYFAGGRVDVYEIYRGALY